MISKFDELYEKFEETLIRHGVDTNAHIAPELWVEYFESLTPQGKILAAEIVLKNAELTVNCLVYHDQGGKNG